MSQWASIAVDLGAESGRVVTGAFDGERLELIEVHRFGNVPLHQGGRLCWNTGGLLKEILRGFGKVSRSGVRIRSVAVDTWGVDFGLIDANGELIEEPCHYRDSRTTGLADKIVELVSAEQLFEVTGVQPHDINTLCQLHFMVEHERSRLDQAARLLMMPNLINFFLSGKAESEFTIASTSQCLDATKRDWAHSLLANLKIPTHLFGGKPLTPGAPLGRLLRPYGDLPGFADTSIIAGAGHDTASAVAAIDSGSRGVAYISSGTWSLMGIVSPTPIVNAAALRLGFTNEGAVEGNWRVLKNITGLWLVQQCRKSWAEQGCAFDYETIVQMAQAAGESEFVFDPDDASLRHPNDMLLAIGRLCAVENAHHLAQAGVIARAIFQSLACKYRQALEQLRQLTGTSFDVIRIAGGGSRNALLCQLTADICQLPVSAGPAETTAVGNLLVQLVASGECRTLAEARAVASQSLQPVVYAPRRNMNNDALNEKFRRL